MKSAAAVTSLLYLVAFIKSIHSRKCYKCSSKKDYGCSKLNKYSTYSIDCPKHFQCSIQLFSRGNNYTTVRSCEPKGVSHNFKLCNTKKCNYQKKENTTFQEGKKLQCYNCTSSYVYNMKRPNPKCEKIDGTKYLVNCKSGEACVTYKAKHSNGSVYFLERRCGEKDWKMELQLLCYNDKCNNMEMPVVKKYVN